MSKRVLKAVADAMASLGLEYEFGEYTKRPMKYPYFVGEYTETEPMTEDGLQEFTVLLNGFSRSTWAALEDAKEKIENLFNRVSGETVIADDGSAVAIFYAGSQIIPTGDAELKRIQITLSVKEWSVSV